MARFLNTSSAFAKIEDIIHKAKQEVVLISPFIKMPQIIVERLKDADKRNIRITLVCRKDDLKPEEADSIKELHNLNLCFLENLHAKCFYNEEAMVITSLNLHEYSQQNNREMGILLTLNDDKETFTEARDEAKFIIRSAVPDKSRKRTFESSLRDGEVAHQIGNIVKDLLTSVTKQEGYCIRCGDRIAFNIEAPYCRKCYGEWAKWQNPDYEESFCHTCGRPSSTTMAKPRCRSCYNRS